MNHEPPTVQKPGNECGTFNDACKCAAEFANRHGMSLESAGRFLARAGWAHAFYGIEHVECAGRELAYLNTGDTYGLTLGQERGGEVIVTTWGGWYETVEQAHCQAEDVIRCGYCSDFTPLADGIDWSETVCESCNNLVGG